MRTSRLIAIAGLLFGLSGQASAATILDTIQGAAFSPTPGNGQSIAATGASSQSLGIPFTYSGGTIQSVEAYIYYIIGLSQVKLGIMNDSSGVPSGTFISGDFFTAPYTAPPQVVNQTGLNWSLAAGKYWLVAVGNPGELEWQTKGGVSGIRQEQHW